MTFPPKWLENGQAGKDWFTNLIRRHSKATSYARAINFSKIYVGKLFDNLSNLLKKYKFEASDIYYLDETVVTIVQKPNKILAIKGTKQVDAVTSRKRGTLVTICAAASAVGNTVPLSSSFLAKNFKHILYVIFPTTYQRGEGLRLDEQKYAFNSHETPRQACETHIRTKILLRTRYNR